MAEGKTITIVQKGKQEETVTIELSYTPDKQGGYKTCFLITPKVNGVTQEQIKGEVTPYFEQSGFLNVPKNATVTLTGLSHACDNDGCKRADGSVTHDCFEALADNPSNARFDGNTTLSFTATEDRVIKVEW